MLELISHHTIAYFTDIASYLINANQRVFWLYLLSAFILGYIAYRQHLSRTANAKSSYFQYLFSPRIWLHQSAKHDYAIFLINKVFKLAGITVSLVVMAPIAISFSSTIEQWFGASGLSNTPIWLVGIAFTAILFVLDDLSRFLLHYLLHKIPFLWEFHKVHHSAKVLTPMTIYRSHPVESLLYATRMAGTQGIAVGISYYFFGATLEMQAILGANAFVFVFNLMGSNLRHSHVWLSWGNALEWIFISPAQHQIHHSTQRKHFDANFGSALAIWDKLFGCHIFASSVAEPSTINFGISKHNTEHTSLAEIYFMPFVLSAKVLFGSVFQSRDRTTPPKKHQDINQHTEE